MPCDDELDEERAALLVAPIAKFFTAGDMYFSHEYDLTRSVQRRQEMEEGKFAPACAVYSCFNERCAYFF